MIYLFLHSKTYVRVLRIYVVVKLNRPFKNKCAVNVQEMFLRIEKNSPVISNRLKPTVVNSFVLRV